MVTKYGFISDVHKDPRIVVPAIEVLKDLGAEKLIFNGDIGTMMPGEDLWDAIKNSQSYTGFILNAAGKSGLETYVQPGSHETILGYEPVAEWAADKFENINSVMKPCKFECEGYDLVFLPGSDINIQGGEYVLGDEVARFSNKYFLGNGGRKLDDWQFYVEAINAGYREGAISYANMNDIERLVTNPDKTIVVSHIPMKFDNLGNGIDMAEFKEAKIHLVHNGGLIERGSIAPAIPETEDNPFSIAIENKGNQDLRDIYEEIGVKKAVSGHFHESVHRACDKQGNHVKEGVLADELFWNASYADDGKVGILSVDGGDVSYQNLDLRDYLR